MNLIKYNQPTDKVKVCTKNLCVEAAGRNAKQIVGALCFMLICMGIAALAKNKS